VTLWVIMPIYQIKGNSVVRLLYELNVVVIYCITSLVTTHIHFSMEQYFKKIWEFQYHLKLIQFVFSRFICRRVDRLCGLVVRVPG
jgi:hypothetical protein